MEINKILWLGSVAFIGALIGYFRKQYPLDLDKPLAQKCANAFFSILTSLFIAYVVFECVKGWTDWADNVAISMAGLGSFAGADALAAAEKLLISWLNKDKK